jgi:hypothetical protein
MSLIIEVEKDGRVTVSIDGVVVGLLKSLLLRVDTDDLLPQVHVVMNNARNMPEEMRVEWLQQALDRYRAALRSHPLIEVSDYHDTLPQGMPAVRPEEK